MLFAGVVSSRGINVNGEQKRGIGWIKRAGIFLLLLAAFTGGLAWWAMPPKEPSCQGETLSWWLTRYENDYGRYDETNLTAIECRDAIQHMGTNLIPTLLGMLKAKDSSLKTRLMELMERQNIIRAPFTSVEDQKQRAGLGLVLLGDLASNAVPALVDIYAHPPTDNSKQIANFTLMQFYPGLGVTTPYWMPTNQRAQWFMQAGSRKSQLSAFSNAVLAYSEAIKLDPANADAYLERGNAKIGLQDFAGAIPDLNKAMELSPANEYAVFSKGLCEFGLRDFKSAETDFTTAINSNTNNEQIYNYRGLARANLRDFKAALADFNQAIAVSPQEATSYRNRAMLETAQKDYELALADASKSIELDRHDAAAYTARGRIKTALKDYQGAIPDYDRALALNPKDSVAYSARAITRVDMDDFDNAAADLEKALQLNPKNPTAYTVRGLLKEKRGGDGDSALADFQRGVELAPKIPESHGLLGLFQYRSHQWEPALANCRLALKLGVTANVAEFNAYIWLIRTQSGEGDAANQELQANLKSFDAAKTNEWSAITIRFLTGDVPESSYLSLATTSVKRPSEVQGQVCESLYYAAMKHKIAGDKSGAAELFQKCLDMKYDNSMGYFNAITEMRALKQP